MHYVSCKSIYQYWRGGLSTDPDAQVRGRHRSLCRVRRGDEKARQPCQSANSTACRVGCAWPAGLGCRACRGSPPPRRKSRANPRPRRPLPWCWMALPGFVSADQRSRAVGMVAVGYGLKSARTARPHRSRRHAALLLPRLSGRRPRPGGFAGSRFQRTVGAHRGEFRVREWVHDNRPAAQVAPGLELVGWFSE